MKWQLSVLIFLLSLITFAVADDAPAEVKALEGTWKVVRMEAFGKQMEPPPGSPDQANVKDGQATFLSGGKELATFKNLKLATDPAVPKSLNLLREDRDFLPCLYTLKDDEWIIAMPLISTSKKPTDSLPRPESFDSTGKPVGILTLKRTKE